MIHEIICLKYLEPGICPWQVSSDDRMSLLFPAALDRMSRGVVVYGLQSGYVEKGVPGWNGLGGETLGARWRQSGLVCDPTDNWQRADLHPPARHS